MQLSKLKENEFKSLFNRIFMLTAIKVPVEIANNPQMFQYLIEEIKKHHGLTDHKIVQTAFEMYANNYLPIEVKTKTMTYVVFNQIMKAYQLKENSSYNRPDADEYEPTEEEKKEIIRKGLLREYENFLKYGMFFNAGNSTHDDLLKMGAFDSFSEETISELKRTAKNDFASYQKIKRNPFMTAIGNGTTLKQVEGYNYCKQFFVNLKSAGVSLEVFLNENYK
jgi:hypothetical protein